MGFFSWITQDGNNSIANQFSNRSTFNVVMVDNKDNKWVEDDYEGYGVFGGKDFYELLAEMNGVVCDLEGEEYTDFMREKGIELAFKNNPSGDNTPGVLYPNLVEDADYWEWLNEGPESCEFQGYFYIDDDLDEEEDIFFQLD